MNTKEKATKEILKKIFESSTKLIMSKKDIKKIETYYKKNSSKFDNVDDFIASNEKIGCLVNRLKSGKEEIGKCDLSHGIQAVGQKKKSERELFRL